MRVAGSVSDKAGVRPVRRIVTGHDGDARSIFASDGPVANITSGAGRPTAHVAWATGAAIAAGDEPCPAGHPFGFHSEGGSLLRIVDFPPDAEYDENALAAFLDAEGVRDAASPRHFWFHKTHSLDYAICLDGEIWAMMDLGETLMKSGDVLIQRATNHSWSNRSNQPCRMAFILLAIPEGETA